MKAMPREPAMILPALLAMIVLLGGCSASSTMHSGRPDPGPAGGNLSSCRAPSEPDAAVSASPHIGDPAGVLTLSRALSLVLTRNPELAGYSWEVRAGEARTLQAGFRPNPDIEAEIEDFGGSKERKSLEVAETTVALSQLIELGGKRSKRERVAALQRDLAGWDYEAKRFDVLTEVTKAFVEVLGAQQQVVYTGELVRLAARDASNGLRASGGGQGLPP